MMSIQSITARGLLLLAVSLGLLLSSGCSRKPVVQEDPVFREWKVKAEEAKPFSPGLRSIEVDLPEEEAGTPPAVTGERQKKEARPSRLPDEPVTITMRNTDVNVILRALARAVDQNIMMNAEVGGVTNVNVKNTPWEQVFLGVLRTRGLTYKWEGDIIRVMTLEDMRHDRNIDEVLQKQKLQSIELKRVEPLLTRVIRINYADAADLGANLEKVLTKKELDKQGEAPRGSVTVDEHNNALIVQAIREDIEKIVRLIEDLDRPTPQVLIEAHIVETNGEVARELGIQWGGLYHSTSGGNNYWITPGVNSSGVSGNPLSSGADPTTGPAANFPAFLPGEAGFSLGYVAESAGDYLLNIQLSALEDANKLNILSKPSITTLDNQTAVIESGAEIPFQTVEDGEVNIEFKDAVLRLEVTPHVIDNQVLKLKIVTNKDEVDFTRTVLGNPTIVKKRAETNLILHDGETTVIGGLNKETSSGNRSGTPGLKDVPGLGYLFGQSLNSSKFEEVLIFITPHILKERKE